MQLLRNIHVEEVIFIEVFGRTSCLPGLSGILDLSWANESCMLGPY